MQFFFNPTSRIFEEEVETSIPIAIFLLHKCKWRKAVFDGMPLTVAADSNTVFVQPFTPLNWSS